MWKIFGIWSLESVQNSSSLLTFFLLCYKTIIKLTHLVQILHSQYVKIDIVVLLAIVLTNIFIIPLYIILSRIS